MSKKSQDAESKMNEKKTPPSPEALQQLERELEAITPEQEEEAKKLYEKFSKGELNWAALWDVHPEEMAALAEQGYLKFKRGKFDDAEMIFKGLSAINDQNSYYHTMLGAIYQKLEKFADALAEYTIAIEINPNDITAFVNRGEIYSKMGYFEEPLEDFEKAIALDETEKNPWAIRAKHLKEILIRERDGV